MSVLRVVGNGTDQGTLSIVAVEAIARTVNADRQRGAIGLLSWWLSGARARAAGAGAAGRRALLSKLDTGVEHVL